MGKKSTPDGVDDAMDSFEDIGNLSEEQTRSLTTSANERQQYDQEQWRKNQGKMEGIVDQQLGYADQMYGAAGEDRTRYEELYQPIEEDYLESVNAWDTPERRGTEAAKAGAEVASQQEAGRQNALRRLESYGVDPSQTRNSALDAGIRTEEAAQKALAANNARTDVEKTAMAMKEGTINAGRGLNTQSNRNAASGQQAIPTFGSDSNELYGNANAALGNWGDSADAVGQIANAEQGNSNSMFGNLLTAGATVAGTVYGGPAGGAAAGTATNAVTSGNPHAAEGGAIEGPGGPKDDAIDIKVSDGEYVIPTEVVKFKGTEFFDKLIQKVKTENAEREQNAQVTADAMATPPPEAIPPEGMGMPMPGMKRGGEIRRLPQMAYPPPPTARPTAQMGAR